MGFYANHIEPVIVSCACGMKLVARERAKIVPQATGRVLEVGFGSGHNAPYYDHAAITHLYALEPFEPIRRRAAKRVAGLTFPLEWLDLPGEEIPLPDGSVDSVLVTYTLCTIPGVEAALAGMRRVLKPGGKLVFLEHGLAPDQGVARWQNRLNKVWGRLSGGCHLNRDPAALVRSASFEILALDQHYARGAPKIAGYMTGGVAAR